MAVLNIKRTSLIFKLTGFAFIGILIIVSLISFIFISAFRSSSFRNIKDFVTENTKHISAKADALINERVLLLFYTGVGTIPLVAEENIDVDQLEAYLRMMAGTMDGVKLLYTSSPGLWTDPGGFLALSSGVRLPDTFDNRTRIWWQNAMAAGSGVIFTDPYIDLFTGELVVTISELIFDENRNPIAVMGKDISIANLGEIINELITIPGMRGFFLHESGKYITNPDFNLIMTGNFFTDFGMENIRNRVIGRFFYGTIDDLIVCSVPLYTTGWTLVTIVPVDYVFAEVNATILRVIIFAALSIFGLLAILFFMIRKIIKPVELMTKELQIVSMGDLTRTIDIKSNDEIGSLAHYFNQTLQSIKNMVINVRSEAMSMSRIGTDLANGMTETAATMNQIAANIQNVKQRVTGQSASVTDTNDTMEQITAKINELNGHVEKQAANVSQSSSAVEEMIVNIGSVTQTLVRNVENVEELTSASEISRTVLQEVAVDIREIARESEGLLEINSVMQNIASQTNLLSMNAAIEAAHAGESGRGFAVVADEIRKLAENSSKQSKTISDVLKRIKGSIDKMTSSTEKLLKRFEAIDSGVKTVAEQEENVRNAMEEQGQGSKQVLEAIGNLNNTTLSVKDGASQMLEGANVVMRKSSDLEQAAQEISGDMNEMASGVAQVNIAVNHITELTNKNREIAAQLMKEVEKFNVDVLTS